MTEDSRWNMKRGLNRLFMVVAVCWYIGSGIIRWNPWTAAFKAGRDAVAVF